jgi:hypothetical protein
MVKGNYQQARAPTKALAQFQINAILLLAVLSAQRRAGKYRRVLELQLPPQKDAQHRLSGADVVKQQDATSVQTCWLHVLASQNRTRCP